MREMWVIDSEKRVFSAAFFMARLAAPNSENARAQTARNRYAKFLLPYLLEVSRHRLHIPRMINRLLRRDGNPPHDSRFMLCSSQIEEAIN